MKCLDDIESPVPKRRGSSLPLLTGLLLVPAFSFISQFPGFIRTDECSSSFYKRNIIRIQLLSALTYLFPLIWPPLE
jgi:hypothetical protein